MLSHGNVSTNVLQAEAWIGKDFREGGVLITAIPLYHIFALSGNCMMFARLGWTNVLIINPRDLPAMMKEMRRHPCNYISGVNTLFNALLHAPGFDTHRLQRAEDHFGRRHGGAGHRSATLEGRLPVIDSRKHGVSRRPPPPPA